MIIVLDVEPREKGLIECIARIAYRTLVLVCNIAYAAHVASINPGRYRTAAKIGLARALRVSVAASIVKNEIIPVRPGAASIRRHFHAPEKGRSIVAIRVNVGLEAGDTIRGLPRLPLHVNVAIEMARTLVDTINEKCR